MSDRLAVLPQYLIPKQALTAVAGRIASARAGQWTTRLIEWFVQRYKVNMAKPRTLMWPVTPPSTSFLPAL